MACKDKTPTTTALEHKGIVIFLVISFGLAWSTWEISYRLIDSAGSPLWRSLWSLLGTVGLFSPAIAALIVRKWISQEGFSDAGSDLNLRKWQYYAVGWLVAFSVIAGAKAISAILGFNQFLFYMDHFDQFLPEVLQGNPVIQIASLFILPLILTPLAWGEEFGWRGYLQQRLNPHHPFLCAVYTGLIWGMWHLPLKMRAPGFPEPFILGMSVFCLTAILWSIVWGWIYQETRSVWSVSLSHASTSLGLYLFLTEFNQWALSLIPLGIWASWIIATGRLKKEDQAIVHAEMSP